MALLEVTGSITVPAGKTLSSASLRVVYLEEYSDGTARYPRIYDLAYDTVNGAWKPAGTANGTTAYIPGADLGDPGPVATFSETQNYSDNSSQSRQWTQNVLATAADEWDYTALMPDYWQLGLTATATLYPAATGRLLRYGAGAPSSSLGVVGDFYIDTTNSRLYGPKLVAGWGSYISIIGPTGPTGATGATGPTGPAGANGVFSGSETIETAIETGDYLYFTDVSASDAPKRITAANAMSEIVDDRVANLIVAGNNITKTYDDSAGTLTIAATAALIDSQVFTSSGTWTKPASAKYVRIICIGAGGGGGAGGRATAASTDRNGAAGGGGGAMWILDTYASVLGATETVTVGLGGSGAAAQSSGTGNQVLPTTGGSSSFGSWLTAPGGDLSASSGLGGITLSPYSGANAGGNSGVAGNAGVQALFAAGGGGGGGGVTTSTAYAGAAGGSGWTARSSWTASTGGGGALGAIATSGTAGTSRSGSGYGGDGGGGGGSRVTSGTAGAGGAGGLPGGGGGGGGASATTGTSISGAGGNGGKGEVIVITWF
jgi:hypothetical protein